MSRLLVLVAAASAALLEGALGLTCQPQALGCYDDSAGPRPVPNAMTEGAGVTATNCVNLCAAQGFGLAGLTGHTTPSFDAFCYCGANVTAGAVLAPASACNIPCQANASQSCGGSYKTQLYAAQCDGPIPTPLPPGPACSQPEVQGLPFCDPSLSFEERASDLLSRLQPQEIGPQLTARQAPAIPRLGIPPYYSGVNAVHGLTNSPLPGYSDGLCLNATGRCVTIWPSGPNFGATWNASAMRLLGAQTAVEMRAMHNVAWGPSAAGAAGVDIGMLWGPTINLVRDPRWGRVQETAGSDPYLNGVFAREIVRGMQEGEDSRFLLAAATLKHAFVYSLEDYHDPISGQHFTRENINNVVSPFDLFDSYTPHFNMALRPVEQGGAAAAGVMMAMNALNGVPCLANSYATGLIKSWAGPNNVYISTDGINMIDSMLAPEPEGHFFCPFHEPPCTRAEGVAAAVMGGSDICDGNEYQETLQTAIDGGNITVGDAQQRLYNALLIRFRVGLFDAAADQPYRQYNASHVNPDNIRAENVATAADSVVLLQNPGAILPFPRGSADATLVIGYAGNSTAALVSNYVGAYCTQSSSTCFPSILQSIAALGETVQFAQGCTSAATCPSDLIAAAAAATASAGVGRIVLTLGISQAQEAEQRDRVNLTISSDQQALLTAVLQAAGSRPVAVVLVHGGALAVPEVKAAPVAVLDAFYPGPAGGQALAQLLFGLSNPGGKLPYDVYDASYATEVNFTDMNVAALGRTYRYRTAGSPGGEPLWPFGFGLSYTTFSLSFPSAPPADATINPTTTSIALTVSVSNTGAVAGDEVLQLYVAPNASSLAPPLPPYVPVRQLIAFERLALAPGQSSDVTVTVNASDLVLTLGDGTRKPVNGQYSLIFSRGLGVGEELTVPVTVAGFW